MVQQNIAITNDRKNIDRLVWISARQTRLGDRRPRLIFEIRPVEAHQSEQSAQIERASEGVDIGRFEVEFLGKKFESPRIRKGRSWVHTFSTSGEIRYYDPARNTMKGLVVVRPAS